MCYQTLMKPTKSAPSSSILKVFEGLESTSPGSGKRSLVGSDRSPDSAPPEDPKLDTMQKLHRILAQCAVRVLARKMVSDR